MSSNCFNLIFDYLITEASFWLACSLLCSIDSVSVKRRPWLLQRALFNIKFPLSIWVIFFSFINLFTSSKIKMLFCFSDSSIMCYSFYCTVFFIFLYYSCILMVRSADFSFRLLEHSDGFLN